MNKARCYGSEFMEHIISLCDEHEKKKRKRKRKMDDFKYE